MANQVQTEERLISMDEAEPWFDDVQPEDRQQAPSRKHPPTTWQQGDSMICPRTPNELVRWLDSRLGEVHQRLELATSRRSA